MSYETQRSEAMMLKAKKKKYVLLGGLKLLTCGILSDNSSLLITKTFTRIRRALLMNAKILIVAWQETDRTLIYHQVLTTCHFLGLLSVQ